CATGYSGSWNAWYLDLW
nr:immunoglobulin heavy chain junction region [Macaca mulatta]MOV37913.1 immunoglobulin heavy chain junction region [Macaca mulatta]MOV38052.1 immunoglobulin heavy chain junction region [Macaca mulatta]MOV38348.1 immunoglobulin heavy chain junction region [Macaca mulatta]MOV38490.1 immunoglobulin heavy chain junction region [Macaca mulatta]